MIGISGKTMPPPPRGDSLPDGTNAQLSPLPATLDDDLHDLRRNLSYGEDAQDLKDALKRAIGLVEQLRTLLKDAHRAHAELEISLKLSRSNLQLAFENNNMLEDALRRESGALGARDVGWRRSRTGTATERPSSRQGLHRASLPAADAAIEEERRRGTSSRRGSTASTASVGAASPVIAAASAPTSPVARPAVASSSSSPIVPAPPASSGADNRRFFGFRFGGSGAASPTLNANGNGSSSRPQTPPLRKPTDAVRDASHLTSASLPSLAEPPVAVASSSKRDEELAAELEAERVKCAKALAEKAELERELESLSQALFEEANKMVAQERIKRAEAEEELQAQIAEKQALQSAMRIVEQENKHLRPPSQVPARDRDEDNGDTRILASDERESRRRTRSPDPITSHPRASSKVRDEHRPSANTGANARSQSFGRADALEHGRHASVSSTRALRTRSRSGSRSSYASGSVVSAGVVTAMPVEESPWAH